MIGIAIDTVATIPIVRHLNGKNFNVAQEF